MSETSTNATTTPTVAPVAVLDIFNPLISEVSLGLKGKTMLLYGSNSTGKTLQATRFEKPYYIGFEAGINCIAGIPYAPIQSWSDFVTIRKQLTKRENLVRAQELYNTIIFDTVKASAFYCQEYLCLKYGVDSIGSGNNGYGLWGEYEKEYWKQINALTNVGYTVIFISHDDTRKFMNDKGEEILKIYPEGDKRSIDPIVDLVDLVVYLQPNGLDENGKEIKSSAFLVNTPEFLARSRFDYMTPYIQEFTAENIEAEIAKAIELEVKATGRQAVTFESKQEATTFKKMTFEELQEAIKEIAMTMAEKGKAGLYKEVVEEVLGTGKKVSEATSKQIQQLELILDELKAIKID